MIVCVPADTKKYSCVRRIHTQLDLLESIIRENDLKEEDIVQDPIGFLL